MSTYCRGRDTERLHTNLFKKQMQLEQLREHPINAGQLLDATMDARGEFALGVYDRFVELRDRHSSYFQPHETPCNQGDTAKDISVGSCRESMGIPTDREPHEGDLRSGSH